MAPNVRNETIDDEAIADILDYSAAVTIAACEKLMMTKVSVELSKTAVPGLEGKPTEDYTIEDIGKALEKLLETKADFEGSENPIAPFSPDELELGFNIWDAPGMALPHIQEHLKQWGIESADLLRKVIVLVISWKIDDMEKQKELLEAKNAQ